MKETKPKKERGKEGWQLPLLKPYPYTENVHKKLKTNFFLKKTNKIDNLKADRSIK